MNLDRFYALAGIDQKPPALFLYSICAAWLPAGGFADSSDNLHRLLVNQSAVAGWPKAVVFCLGKTDGCGSFETTYKSLENG